MSPLAAIAYREMRIRMVNPIFPLWDVFVPVVYLLVFGAGLQGFLGAEHGGNVDYPTFLLGGVLSMVTFSIAWNSSYAWFEDMQSGIFHELLTYPFPRGHLLLGKLMFNASFSILAAGLCLLAAMTVLQVTIIPSRLPMLLLWLIVGAAAWYFLFAFLALVVRGFNAYHTTTSAFFILLMFVSNLFYPADRLPGPLTWVAWANPVTWQTDLLRYYSYGPEMPYLQWEAAALLVFTIGIYAVASHKLNGTIE
ncbi:MAG: ABC transporter permease [Candidatus Korobacteraceae bacterium]